MQEAIKDRGAARTAHEQEATAHEQERESQHAAEKAERDSQRAHNAEQARLQQEVEENHVEQMAMVTALNPVAAAAGPQLVDRFNG